MTPDQQQAWADFQLKEWARHKGDIDQIENNLAQIEARFGIKPRDVWVDTWIECGGE